MTREEAIRRMEICRNFLANNYSDMGELNFTAFNMAISALEQQPCDDAISREELLEAIDTWDKFGYTETGCFVRITKEIDNYVPYVHLEDVITAIQKLPSVTQKLGTWIVDLQTATEDYYICSKCGRKIHLLYPDTISNYPYCHCGAKMKSEDKE